MEHWFRWHTTIQRKRENHFCVATATHAIDDEKCILFLMPFSCGSDRALAAVTFAAFSLFIVVCFIDLFFSAIFLSFIRFPLSVYISPYPSFGYRSLFLFPSLLLTLSISLHLFLYRLHSISLSIPFLCSQPFHLSVLANGKSINGIRVVYWACISKA